MRRLSRESILHSRLLRRWHRYAGFTAAIFVCILAVTGLLLNRTDLLELDHHYLSWPPLLDWYGIKAPTDVVAFTAGGRTLALIGHRLFLDEKPLPGEYSSLQGATAEEELIVAAADRKLLLFSVTGELVESVSGAPAGVSRIGRLASGEVAIDAAAGVFVADADLLTWHGVSDLPAKLAWATPTAPASALLATLTDVYRGESLSWERVLLDLHSGRLFGRYGSWLMDSAAVLLLVLVVTGTWIWTRTKT